MQASPPALTGIAVAGTRGCDLHMPLEFIPNRHFSNFDGNTHLRFRGPSDYTADTLSAPFV